MTEPLLENEMSLAYKELLRKDCLVRSMHMAGVPLQQQVVVLSATLKTIREQYLEQSMLVPFLVKTDNGQTLRWDPPNDRLEVRSL
jgi:hypothetical protein